MTALRDRLRGALNQPARDPVARRDSVTDQPDLSLLGGRWFESPHGPGYVVESVYEAGYEHGRVPVHRALSLDMARLAPQSREPRLSFCHPRDLLYVDTETTGMGGAGVMVFLAGVARFDGSLLRLRQYLLPSPMYEGGLLGGLAQDIAQAAALVSYNGKSFDVPMLESRYILSRMPSTVRQLPHLDLLHPNRRLFRGAFDSHRLVRMEQELLGFEREDDCPSSDVPRRYFEFQRSGDPTPILPVLRHNAWDILSLVALAAHLAAVVRGEEEPLQAGRAAHYAGDHESAISYFEAALSDGNLGRATRSEALERLARASTRLGRYEVAAGWWRQLIEEPRTRRLTPYVELAKLQEHRLKDLPAALATTESAISLVERGTLLPRKDPGPTNHEISLEALHHRRARLQTRSAQVSR